MSGRDRRPCPLPVSLRGKGWGRWWAGVCVGSQNGMVGLGLDPPLRKEVEGNAVGPPPFPPPFRMGNRCPPNLSIAFPQWEERHDTSIDPPHPNRPTHPPPSVRRRGGVGYMPDGKQHIKNRRRQILPRCRVAVAALVWWHFPSPLPCVGMDGEMVTGWEGVWVPDWNEWVGFPSPPAH